MQLHVFSYFYGPGNRNILHSPATSSTTSAAAARPACVFLCGRCGLVCPPPPLRPVAAPPRAHSTPRSVPWPLPRVLTARPGFLRVVPSPPPTPNPHIAGGASEGAGAKAGRGADDVLSAAPFCAAGGGPPANRRPLHLVHIESFVCCLLHPPHTTRLRGSWEAETQGPQKK